MKVSLNTIKFVNHRYKSAGDPALNGVDDLIEKIGAQLGAIENMTDVGTKYEGVIIVRIVDCTKHPNADKLSICTIDDNGVTANIDRDNNGYVQVVCGAQNVRPGLLAAWLPPGSTVPESVDKDPFVLSVRGIRGVTSNGMLASARELALGDSHDGILEVGQFDDNNVGQTIKPGTSFVEAYYLQGDVVLDIENKMFTHRPDCFGFMGVAREIEGIHQRPYKSPAWYSTNTDFPVIENDVQMLPLVVRNELPDLVPRFCAITMSNVAVGPSPVWLQIGLAKVGLHSINNIVDYTNFFMLETGQPLHAYDYDKVKALDADHGKNNGATIVIRHPQPGEKINLLNGKEIEPRAEAILIATKTSLIAIGGVMGGVDTEVDENTTNIILEVANFDMYSIRRTSMTHGLFTDAVIRFNKGQSPLQNRAIIAKIVDEIRTSAGGKVASELIDDIHLPAAMIKRNSVHAAVTLASAFVNNRLGTKLTAEAMKVLLTNVEFDVGIDGDSLTIKAPFWRTDIEIPEDIVEEIGRLYGFDHLPLELPQRSIVPSPKNELIELKQHVREALSRAGANEVLLYSFVHGKLLEKANQDLEQAFKLSNALSPDLQYYRLSLTPSLLDKVHTNIKAGHDKFALFEIGKSHNVKERDLAMLPLEAQALSFVFAADSKTSQHHAGSAYYQARAYVIDLLTEFNLMDDSKMALEPLSGADLHDNPRLSQMTAPYDPARSAVLRDSEGSVWGVVGEFRSDTSKALKLPSFCAGFELDLLFLLQSPKHVEYRPLSKYPKIEQDICLRVAADMPYQQLYSFVSQHVSETIKKILPDSTRFSLSPIDIYQRPDDLVYKQITVRLTIASYIKTLRASEVATLLDIVAELAKSSLGAARI